MSRPKSGDWANPRAVRFLREEDRKLMQAANRLGTSVSNLIRICVVSADLSKLPANALAPQTFLVRAIREQHENGSKAHPEALAA